MEISKKIKNPFGVFDDFDILNSEHLNISVDVWQKSSVTRMELFDFSENPCVCFYEFDILNSKIWIFQ